MDEGFLFITHKAGGDKDDPELAAWWSKAKGQRGRALLGAYWVLYPGNPAGRADAFLARLDSQCSGWRDGPFILQVDCEIWNGDQSTKPGKADIRVFCDRLRAKMPKLMPIVYASQGQYGDSLAGLNYPLWNARYRLGYTPGYASTLYARSGGDSGAGWDEYSGRVPAIWQFTSSATIAGQTTCDANAFRGTLDQLKRLLAPGWVREDLDMPITDDDAEKVADKVWSRLFTRPDGPDAHGNTKTSAGAYQAYSDVQPRVEADRVIATLAPLIKGLDVDEAAIAQAVLSGLSPAALTDAVVAALQALPAETAQATADEIARRLSPAQPNG